MRTFKDPTHKAWRDVGVGDVKDMWADFRGMGISFVDGVMPPYEDKKKAEKAAAAAAEAKATTSPAPPASHNTPPANGKVGLESGKPVLVNGHKEEPRQKQSVEAAEGKINGHINGSLADLKPGQVLAELSLNPRTT